MSSYRLPSPPSSSPPSSPAFGPVDSSPPSSPSPFSTSSPPGSPGVSHPFAASTKAARRPHLYEKRESRSRWLEDNEDSFESRSPGKQAAYYASPSKSATTLAHPLAASAKGSWKPPRREKKGHSRTTSEVSFASTSAAIGPFVLGSPKKRSGPPSEDWDTDLDLTTTDEERDLSVSHPSRSLEDRRVQEREIWDRIITTAIDEADGFIDLSQNGVIGGEGLTTIPPSISDLASLVVLPSGDTQSPASPPRNRALLRAASVPARVASAREFLTPTASRLQLGKTNSLAQDTSTIQDDEIHLLLHNNSIKRLPAELFSLRALTVLNMRNNHLVRIPPQIRLLVNLRELNISQNKLEYLPSEMLQMHLKSLALNSNPWRSPPNSAVSGSVPPQPPPPLSRRLERTVTQPTLGDTKTSTPTTQPRIVADTHTHFIIPSLMEYCLRTLVAPHRVTSTDPNTTQDITVLEALSDRPLSQHLGIPQPLIDILQVCAPRAVAKPDRVLHHVQVAPSKRARYSRRTSAQLDSTLLASWNSPARPVLMGPGSQGVPSTSRDEDKETHPGVGICPSPFHTGERPAVFVEHAEETFSWETTIAGVDVVTNIHGGPTAVPVLWRGCSRGCLSFLDNQSNHCEQHVTEDKVEEEEKVLEDDGDESDGPVLAALSIDRVWDEEFD